MTRIAFHIGLRDIHPPQWSGSLYNGDKSYSATVLAHRPLTQVLYSILPSSLERTIMSWLDWWLSTYKRWLFMSHIYFFPFKGHTSVFICVATSIVNTTRQLPFPADHLLWGKEEVIFILTVWAAADKGVLWTGVRLWLRLSHRTIWPEYVPPTTRFGWKRAKQTDITEDWGKRGREERGYNGQPSSILSPGKHTVISILYFRNHCMNFIHTLCTPVILLKPTGHMQRTNFDPKMCCSHGPRENIGWVWAWC